MDLPFGRSFLFWEGGTGEKGLGKERQVWAGSCKERQVERLGVGGDNRRTPQRNLLRIVLMILLFKQLCDKIIV